MKQCVLKLVISLSLFVAQCGNVCWALESLESKIEVPTLVRQRQITITLVLPKASLPHLEKIVSQTREAAALTQQKMGASFIDDFAIYFDGRPDYHNGLATVIPTNRIAIHLEAPDLESSIGLGRDFLIETIVHEMSHMIVTQQRAGIFRAFDWVFGNASRPLGAWPRWMHEGLAVWTEGVVGGRPHSGVIDFDLRRYADYFDRFQKHPFSNNEMDANAAVELVEEGVIPYHFGYLLIDSWNKKRKEAAWQILFDDFARSPGISFRVLFRNAFSQSLEDFFEEHQKAWASFPLPQPQLLSGVELARAPSIQGPFSFRLRLNGNEHRNSLAWIESSRKRDSSSLLNGRLDSGTLQKTRWSASFTSPVQNFLRERDWVVLFMQLPRLSTDHFLGGLDYSRKRLGIFDFKGRRICEFRQFPDRVREISLHDDEIAWVRTLTDLGTQVVERARLGVSCELFNVREVARSHESFERLSALSIDEHGETFSRSTRYPPFEIVESNQHKIAASDTALSQAYRWGDYLLMHSFGRSAVEPLLAPIQKDGQVRPEARRLLLRTGSTRSAKGSLLAPDRGGFLVVKEGLWESDRLVEVPLSKFTEPLELKPSTTVAPSNLNLDESKIYETKVYQAWPSIWPQFWLPTLLAYSGGYTLFGQSFYADLSGQWSGATVLGYQSESGRPFASSSLSRKGFESGPFSSLNATLYYSPSLVKSRNANILLERYGLLSSVDSTMAFVSSGLRLRSSLSARFEKGRSSSEIGNLSYFAPGISFGISSSRAVSSLSSGFRLAGISNAYLANVRYRYIHGPEILTSMQGQLGWRRLGLITKLEHAHTAAKNYPASYFEFGGAYSFSTSLPTFVTRGFAPQLGIARELIRAESQLGFPLTHFKKGASWSRFRWGQLDAKLIAETITFTPFNGSRFSLGRGYFSSYGGEFDLFGTFSQYINYTATIGLYRGIGEFGETRMALRIASVIDL